MENMLFISRHRPTEAQCRLAAQAGYEIVHVGDVNAFDRGAVRSLLDAHQYDDYPCVACVHPLIAMEALLDNRHVAVFENANRAPEGEKPSFEAVGIAFRFL